MDKTGLGNQTRNLVEMLNPGRVLVIDSTVFGKGPQYPSWYTGYNAFGAAGMLRPSQGMHFIRGLDAVLSCEMFYSETMINDAKRMGIKTLLQYNYEFLAHNQDTRLTKPDLFISPSYWRIDEAREKFNNVAYLPPPTNEKKFKKARLANLSRTGKKKFLHIYGNAATEDRNGTLDLLEALKYTTADFTLHIKAQKPLGVPVTDNRVVVDYSNPNDEAALYEGYDALILPRRYAGLCLPMNEALMSALPVIMTDVDPNNKILPNKWLVKATKKSELMTKILVDVYESDLQELGSMLDWLCKADLLKEKNQAYEIGYSNFSYNVLRPKYIELLKGTVGHE